MLTFKKVDSKDELTGVYKLRFKVYCLERGFESERFYPNQCEMDEYDAYSVHFIAKSNTQIVGTLRLVLNNPIGFPIEKYCEFNISSKGIKKEQTAEISRFAISKEIIKSIDCDRREIVLGLFRETYHESKKLRINYFCAAMEKSLYKLLSRCGVIFSQAGPIVNYHGLRAPYISEMKNIEKSILIKDFNLFRFITSPQRYQYAQLQFNPLA